MFKYEEIARDLHKKIIDGTYPVKEALPNQKELGEEYGASRITVQRALDILAEKGLVFSIQGSGTYVKVNALVKNIRDSRADEYEGLTKHMQHSDEESISSEVLRFVMRNPTEEEALNLMLEEEDFIYDIIRLRLLNGEEYSIEHTLMPIEIAPGLNKNILLGSIYSYLMNELKLKIGGSSRRITAEQPDKYDKKHLKCSPEDPVLQVEQIVYLNDGTPFEYSKTRHRYDQIGIRVVDHYES